MIINFDLDTFIKRRIVCRDKSLLAADLAARDKELKGRIEGRRVLVIGGAGTIGSYYIKALLRFNIAALVVVDTSENGLTELVRDLRSSGEYSIPATFITYPVNFGSKLFEKIFRAHGPFDIVANFAAHKHVRSEKDVFSVEAMLQNNLFATRDLLELLAQRPPEHFFCVSTDKAANPVNIMGASKKLMEELIMAYSQKVPITTARFANVAFSNGSLLAGFIERINKRQPLPCPDDIRRFFVSPEEAGELCLVASVMGQSGDIFFPKLDKDRDMIEFKRVALDFVKALGMEADICQSEDEAIKKAKNIGERPARYPVYFFHSDTSGEKEFEEFFTEGEVLDEHSFINLGIIKNSRKRKIEEVGEIVGKLKRLFDGGEATKENVVGVLKEYLPNFSHLETGKNLDQKM